MIKDYSDDNELYKKIISLLETKHVIDASFIRMGSKNDGGYVCVNDFSNNDYLLSFGIEKDVTFEQDISNYIFGADLYDYSIDYLPDKVIKSRFFKEKITGNSLHVFDRVPKNKDLILKIDIEGGEWDFLRSLSKDHINRFRQILIEIHWGIDNQYLSYPDIPIEIIEKINETHQLVVLHPNNYSSMIKVGNGFIPQVIELTFLRRSSYKFNNIRNNVSYLLSKNNIKAEDLYFMNSENAIQVYDNFMGNLVFPEYDNIIAKNIIKDGIWEKTEFDFIKNKLKGGDVCINVGANVGYFTTLMSKLVGDSGKVFSIEANPNFEFYLRENSQRSGYKNTKIIISAAGNISGTTDLFLSNNNCGDNRVYDPSQISNLPYDNFTLKKQPLKINIDKVDNLVKTNRLDFVLIDCQGWDHEVIRGMKKLINLYKPYIVFEFVPEWISKLGESPLLILEEFKNMGYDIICPDLNIYSPNELNKIANIYNENKLTFVNVHMKPNNK